MAYDGVRRLIGQREYMAIGNNRQSSNIDVLLDFNTVMYFRIDIRSVDKRTYRIAQLTTCCAYFLFKIVI